MQSLVNVDLYIMQRQQAFPLYMYITDLTSSFLVYSRGHPIGFTRTREHADVEFCLQYMIQTHSKHCFQASDDGRLRVFETRTLAPLLHDFSLLEADGRELFKYF